MRGVGAVVAVVLAISAGSTGPGDAAVSQAAPARQLAAQIMAARTPAARYAALIRLLRTLHVGVYKPDGRAVIRGAERGSRDFYLYDFEVRALATALARHHVYRSDDVSSVFRAGKVAPRGHASINPATIGPALTGGVRYALAHPSQPGSLVPLVVRELGLRHGYDLAKGVRPERLRLDAVQFELVVLDGVLPGLRHTVRGFRVRAGTQTCPPFGGGPADWILSGITWQSLGGLTDHATVGRIVDLLQAVQLADVTVEVASVGPVLQATHFGPPGHAPDAGKELRFTMAVVSWTTYTGTTQCGVLAGISLPQSPIAGAAVHWQPGPLAGLGTVTADDRTDSSGRASLVFRPKNEPKPGQGEVEVEAGLLTARPSFELIPSSPGLSTLLAAAASVPATFLWQVSRHVVGRGWTFATEFDWHLFEGITDRLVANVQVALSGRVCSADPFAKPFAVQAALSSQVEDPVPDSFGTPRSFAEKWQFQQGKKLVGFLGDYQDSIKAGLWSAIDEMHLVGGKAPRLEMYFYFGSHPNGRFWSDETIDQRRTVPLVPVDSCS